MNTFASVAIIALAAAVVLYGVGHALVWSLLLALRWRSPFRLAFVLLLWLAASTLVVLPLFAMLQVPGAIAATRESWPFFAWLVGSFGASAVPFALVVGRRMELLHSVYRKVGT